MSLTAIVAELSTVPKGTVYYWIKDQPVAALIRRPNTLAATRATVEKWDRSRAAWTDEAALKAPLLLQDRLFRDFIALFAGEGSRKDRHTVSLVNTDPYIISAAFKAMRHLPGGSSPRLSLRLYPDHQVAVELAFWRDFLQLERNHPVVVHIKPSSGLKRELHTCAHGIMRVRFSSVEAKIIVDRCLQLLREEWRTGT